MNGDFQELIEFLEGKFGRIEERLGGMDGRLGGMDGRLGGMGGRLDGIDGRLDGMDGRLDGMDGRLDGIEERLDGMGGRLDGIDGRLDGIDGRLDGMDGRIANVEAGVEGNRTAIRELGVLVERNHGLIQTVAERVGAVDQKVDQLRSEMKDEFREHREMLRTSHGGLDRRVTDLERRVDVLEEGR